MNRTPTLAILIFNDVEVLDFCGPFEVFCVAIRFTDPAAFNVRSMSAWGDTADLRQKCNKDSR